MPEAAPTILLVEDELLIAADEQKELEEEGYTVFFEATGEKAVEFVRNQAGRIDLILMDINLGRGMDGTQTAGEILKEYNIPILFLSAYTDRGTVDKTENVSSYGFVVKTSGIAVLSASIRMAINLHRVLRELQSPEEAPGSEDFTDEFLPPAAASAGKAAALFSSSMLQAALESTADAILIVDLRGTISGYNSKFVKMWRIPEEILAGKIEEKALDFVMGQLADPDAFRERVREAYRHPDKDGFDLWHFKDGRLIESYSRPQSIGGRPVGRVWSCRDVTESKRMEETLRESRRLLDEVQEISKVGGWEYDPEKVRMIWTDEIYRINGQDKTFDPNDRAKVVALYVPEDREIFKQAFAAAVRDGTPYDLELRLAFLDGKLKWVRTIGRPRMKDGKVVKIVGNAMDITERKRAEEALRRTVREKEVLMKEIRHRIKNSLAIVSGLVTMESGNLTDPKSREIFVNTRARIHSISSIYEQLDRSIDPGVVDLRALITNLTDSLVKTYAPDAGRFVLKISLDEVQMDTKRAFPLVLILNELITNAIKYAYPEVAGGEIRIDLRKSDGKIALHVEDDGAGLPEGIDPNTAESTGLSLIRMLAEQIDAGWIFKNGKGGVKVSLELVDKV
jgi:PAS domain S-box-containing protein